MRRRGAKSGIVLLFWAALALGFSALFGSAPGAPPQRPVFEGVERVVAVGDLHGAYDEFLDILRGTRLVDGNLRWAGGRDHLVQIGDVLDRGPGARKIFDLIRRLEGEASAAGGRVHMLIGNHEALALMGLTFDYEGFVTVEQFLSFLPERFRRRREDALRRKAGPGADLAPLWEEVLRSDLGAQSAYFEFLREQYGRWIADHDTAVKIDGVVFVHGGFNEAYSAWPLSKLNRSVSMELLAVMENRPPPPRIIFDTRGPLWYRDDALSGDNVIGSEIDRVLDNLKARALVVGHTPTPGSMTVTREGMSRLGGKVWTIDTGIWDPVAGRKGALIIKNGIFSVWSEDDDKDKSEPLGFFGRGPSLGRPRPALR